MIRFAAALALALALAAVPFVSAADDKPAAPAAPAPEVKPLKVLLVIGGCCHDYENQAKVLKEGLEKRANVEITVAYDADKSTRHLNPVYESDDWAKGYDAVIHDECSADVKDMAIVERILKPHQDGVPGVNLHCAMHSYRTDGWNVGDKPTPWQLYLGLQTTRHGPQKPIDVSHVAADHPIVKGVENWTTINEELYNNSAGKLLDTATALSRGKQGADDTVVTWVNTYHGKTRVFSTTLGHNTQTVADARYLDLVTRGLLWACGKVNDDGSVAAGYARN